MGLLNGLVKNAVVFMSKVDGSLVAQIRCLAGVLVALNR